MNRRALLLLVDTAKSFRLVAAVVTAMVLSGAPLVAHDMWIEPTRFSPATGEIVGARLRIGQDFLGDPLPHDDALIREFIVEDSNGRRPLVGHNGADPAGLLRVMAPGLMIIGYHSNPSTVELTADKFTTYLKDEGLDAVAAIRTRRGETGGAREVFSRCAKSLVISGAPDKVHGDRSLGFTLELVAERNPYTMAAGQDLPIRLTYQGRPLAGALVVAINSSDGSAKLTARSGKDGRVQFRLPRSGMWLIKAVHMIPAQPDSHADWESFWASLTFDLPGSIDAPSSVSR